MIIIYPRVSTLGQYKDGTSIDTQIELGWKKIKELKLPENEVMVCEEKESGEDIDRATLNQIRQWVAEGLITHFITLDPDRFSRDLSDKLVVCKEFERCGVNLIFVDAEYPNTPEGQLFFNMRSAMAQFELQQIKRRTSRGRLKSVEKYHKIMPMPIEPYGYNYKSGQLIINEKEAEFVKLIFQWYAHDHLTMRQIGEKLISLGAYPKKGQKNWNASSIRRVLSNKMYIGIYYYNRRKTNKIKGEKTASGKPKKKITVRDESEWISAPCPAIINEELFNIAEAQKEKNTKKSGNNKFNYLLKSLIKCGYCGRTWGATSYTGRTNTKTGEIFKYLCYKCPNSVPRKYGEDVQKCPSKSIRADMLDDYVWQDICNNLLNIDKLERRISNQDQIKTLNKTIENYNSQIRLKTKARDKIKNMFINEVISEKEMISDMSKINSEIENLENEIKKINQQILDINLNKQKRESIKSIFTNIKSMINNSKENSFEEKRQVVEMLIDKINLEYDEKDNVVLTYVGILGEIIDQNKGLCLQPSISMLSTQHQDNVNTIYRFEKPIRFTYQSQFIYFRTPFGNTILKYTGTENQISIQ
jgi:site-specific DNA recombinase